MAEASYSLKEISYSDDSGILALAVSGMLDTGNAAAFRSEANKMASGRQELKTIRLNIEGLSYVSSMGIGSIVEWMMELRKQRVTLLIINTPVPIKSVMDLLGFSKFLNLAEEGR